MATRGRRSKRGLCSNRISTLTRRLSQPHRSRLGQRWSSPSFSRLIYLRRNSRFILYHDKTELPWSNNHKPYREDEAEGIEAAGGKVIRWNGVRVFGVLAMSTSIGDRYLKPSLIPDSEIMTVRRVQEDDCLILMNDDVWDVTTMRKHVRRSEAYSLVAHSGRAVAGDASLHTDERSGEGKDPAAMFAAEYLSKLALKRGSKDNITVVVANLKSQRKFKSKLGALPSLLGLA